MRELYQLTELHFRLDLDQTQRGIILQKQMNGVDSIHVVNSPPLYLQGVRDFWKIIEGGLKMFL